MTELLHAWAIAPAAIGACCLAADRGRARWADAAASALMLISMLDAAVARLVAPVYWAALLLLTAMALAVWQRPRRRAAAGPRTTTAGMSVHAGLGLVAMAALQLTMVHGGSATTISSPHGVHGGEGATGLPIALLFGGALAYAALSAFLMRHAHRTLDRAQLACMGASVMLMAVGAAL